MRNGSAGRHHAGTSFVRRLSSLLMLFGALWSNAALAATYNYTASNYTTINGSGTPAYTTAMHLAGSMSTTSPIPPNLNGVDIGPFGSNLIQSWSFTDGLYSYVPANSSLVSFVATTDATGNLTNWSFLIETPKSPNTVGQVMNVILVGAGSAQSLSSGTCAAVSASFGNACGSYGPLGSTASNGVLASIGTFSTAAPPPSGGTLSAAPNPALQGQTVVLTATTGSSATGTVTFTDGATALCNAVPLATGAANCTASALAVGSHTITATFSLNGVTAIVFTASTTVTVNAVPAAPAVPAPALGVWAFALLTTLLALAGAIWKRQR